MWQAIIWTNDFFICVYRPHCVKGKVGLSMLAWSSYLPVNMYIHIIYHREYQSFKMKGENRTKLEAIATFIMRGFFYTLRPRKNGRHFADDIFKCIFLNENVWIPIKISLNFVPRVPINNIPALVQIIIWNNDGYITDAYMRHSASVSKVKLKFEVLTVRW